MPISVRSIQASQQSKQHWTGFVLRPCAERPADSPGGPLKLRGMFTAFGKPCFGSLACIFLVAGVMSLGCRERGPRIHRIASSSMEPALHGPGLLTTCIHCGSASRIAADTYRAELPVRCYCCGGICRVASAVSPGDTVRIEPFDAKALIRRFDLVAFHRKSPTDGTPSVKRVWGLPGEHIDIRDGELWQNGRLFQKSLDELLQVGIGVAKFPDRQMGQWHTRSADGKVGTLDASQARFRLNERESLCWTYFRPANVALQETSPESWRAANPLDDDYIENQGLSYQLQPVTDYFLHVRFQSELDAPCVLECRFQGQWIRIGLTPPNHDVRQADSSEHFDVSVQGELNWIVGLCEGRMMVRSDLSEAIRDCSELRDDSSQATHASELFRLTSLAGVAELEELAIGRDLYLRTPHRDGAGEQSFEVREGTYFVLGDNQPASVDSRSALGMLPQKQIVGLVEKRP